MCFACLAATYSGPRRARDTDIPVSRARSSPVPGVVVGFLLPVVIIMLIQVVIYNINAMQIKLLVISCADISEI